MPQRSMKRYSQRDKLDNVLPAMSFFPPLKRTFTPSSIVILLGLEV